MKPLPAPNVSGNTEAERFDNAVYKILRLKNRHPEGRGEVEAGTGQEEAGGKAVTVGAAFIFGLLIGAAIGVASCVIPSIFILLRSRSRAGDCRYPRLKRAF